MFLLLSDYELGYVAGVLVSIPYSSGQCFFYTNEIEVKISLSKFQSLIHQVSVSFLFLTSPSANSIELVSIPYSSGQCFFLEVYTETEQDRFLSVSIPYSSGQCFF